MNKIIQLENQLDAEVERTIKNMGDLDKIKVLELVGKYKKLINKILEGEQLDFKFK